MKRFILVLLPLVIGGCKAPGSPKTIAEKAPTLPTGVSQETIKKGRLLFQKNQWMDTPFQYDNYLGRYRCSACHDRRTKLTGQKIAKNLGVIRERINWEIKYRSKGQELPSESPAMESLVQYIYTHYEVYKHRTLDSLSDR